MNDNSNTPILDVRHLSIAIKSNRLIDDVSFSVYPGEYVMIQGPNGIGKTTIFEALLGMGGRIKIQSGEFFFKGEPLNDYQSFRKQIAYVSQDDKFIGNTPYENAISYLTNQHNQSLFSHNRITSEDHEFIKDMFDRFNAKHILHKRNLSGGEKRLSSLIAAFCRKDALLYLLDEPINKLFKDKARLIGMHLKDLSQQGKGILLITHCRMFIYANKAYEIIKGGKMVQLKGNALPKACDLK